MLRTAAIFTSFRSKRFKKGFFFVAMCLVFIQRATEAWIYNGCFEDIARGASIYLAERASLSVLHRRHEAYERRIGCDIPFHLIWIVNEQRGI